MKASVLSGTTEIEDVESSSAYGGAGCQQRGAARAQVELSLFPPCVTPSWGRIEANPVCRSPKRGFGEENEDLGALSPSPSVVLAPQHPYLVARTCSSKSRGRI